jgi:hypothetical protein
MSDVLDFAGTYYFGEINPVFLSSFFFGKSGYIGTKVGMLPREKTT